MNTKNFVLFDKKYVSQTQICYKKCNRFFKTIASTPNRVLHSSTMANTPVSYLMIIFSYGWGILISACLGLGIYHMIQALQHMAPTIQVKDLLLKGYLFFLNETFTEQGQKHRYKFFIYMLGVIALTFLYLCVLFVVNKQNK